MLSLKDFAEFHQIIHRGKRPFAWQQRLLEQVIAEKTWPDVLDLPTGVGKTTCIDIAVFALALDAANPPGDRWCPRRIAIVVDRRIVVDQVAERGRTIMQALMTSHNSIVLEVASRLRSLTRNRDEPLGVFALRGGIPKDDGWARTPDQPIVIASTVDQIGSRILIQGYGVSQGMKPVHAGLLANDTLLLLDEVHLSEPFRQTLDQLKRLRTRFSQKGLPSRFLHSCLSATPRGDSGRIFTLLDQEKNIESPLGPRLHASKPVTLFEVDGRTDLEKMCIVQAQTLLQRHRTIAVVVNRVLSANVIASCLSDSLGPEVEVTLLTGRMRPLDRDQVLQELKPAIRTERTRSNSDAMRVIVATQCIEAGADFDFDAMVTEAASLDSLRQRFGRVDRLGEYGRAEGVIVYDTCKTLKEALKQRKVKKTSGDEDPIYGKSIAETFKWLQSQEKERLTRFKDEFKRLNKEAKMRKGDEARIAEANITKMQLVDFGVLALGIPTAESVDKLLSPKSDAPALLPAYLDLWAQTYPAPTQVPDVSLWLHGPKAAPADVQVIWRADLSEELLRKGDVEAATAIVASVRPSSLEALSLPYAATREWLINGGSSDIGDIEGFAFDRSFDFNFPGRPALRWSGDESEIVEASRDSDFAIRPGDTIIVPTSYGGLRRGCFDSKSVAVVKDLAEQAAFFSRAVSLLRLTPNVTANLDLSIQSDDVDDARSDLGRLAKNESLPAWKRRWAELIAKGSQEYVVQGASPWSVIEGNRISLPDLQSLLQADDSFEYGVDLTSDGDDSFCSGRAVSLADHSRNVETIARQYARGCGLGPCLTEHVALAAWLHDIGKADRRFQIMLRGGSEIAYFKDEMHLAKSAMPAGARAARKVARERSGYPSGGYFHAIQSVAMLDGKRECLEALLKKECQDLEPEVDLVLYLISSHHGECRPFAPVVVDLNPIEISLTHHISGVFGEIEFSSIPSNSALHRLDSPVADRFWGLIEKYGWQELCWLEAILRLADHRASEGEQRKEVF
jgi:CRISPR-associated endonuclease/helicase Cas3